MSSSSSSSSDPLNEEDRLALLRIAKDSVRHGLDYGTPLRVEPLDFAGALRQHRATFVTLRIGGELRGCIGTLEARRSLVEDVSASAFGAAFRDTRFTPLTDHEFLKLHYHISILSPPEPMDVTSEEDLLSQLRPGIDGVILEEPPRRATFLPDVWESVPDQRAFLSHLKAKGGWPRDYWSTAMRVSRYTTQSVEWGG